MQSFRRQFGKRLNRLTGGWGSAVGAASRKPRDADLNYADRFYVLALIVIIALSFLVIIFGGNTVLTQALLAAMFGVFVGGTFLFYFHRKLIITVFGALIGAGTAEIKSVVDGLQRFTDVSTQLTATLNSAINPPPQIYNFSVFLFLLIVLIFCLPAYGGSE